MQISWTAIPRRRSLITMGIVLLLLLGCYKTVLRNRDWMSRESLIRFVNGSFLTNECIKIVKTGNFYTKSNFYEFYFIPQIQIILWIFYHLHSVLLYIQILHKYLQYNDKSEWTIFTNLLLTFFNVKLTFLFLNIILINYTQILNWNKMWLFFIVYKSCHNILTDNDGVNRRKQIHLNVCWYL